MLESLVKKRVGDERVFLIGSSTLQTVKGAGELESLSVVSSPEEPLLVSMGVLKLLVHDDLLADVLSKQSEVDRHFVEVFGGERSFGRC